MPSTSTNICRPKFSIFFSSFCDCQLADLPKNWRVPVNDYAEVSPDSLYLVYPLGTVITYVTATAVKNGVLCLPDCHTDFTEDLLRYGKHKVLIHGECCYVYTPAKFKKLLERAGRKSLRTQLAFIKSQIAKSRQNEQLTETLVSNFTRGL